MINTRTKVFLAIDAGGTYYKTALINLNGTLVVDSFRQIPSMSTEIKSIVINQFETMLKEMVNLALFKEVEIIRVCLDFPGPFDYIKCCSLMKHKFVSIKGIPLKPLINSITGCTDIQFHYDLHASVMGAYLFDEALGFSRIYCIGIGTGLGAGFLKDGEIVSYNHGQPKYPIFQMKLGEHILEDFVSNRGIVNEYKKRTFYKDTLDAKKVEDFARMGDPSAIYVYQNMGNLLGKSIKDLLIVLEVECVVFCGQISKGYDYFGLSFSKIVKNIPSLKKITAVKDFDSLALRGVCFLSEEI